MRRVGARDQPAARRCSGDAVVADQPREHAVGGAASSSARARLLLPAPEGAADQDAALADHDGASHGCDGVGTRPAVAAHLLAAGSQTMKRAPSTVAVALAAIRPVLRPDPAAVRLDDLARDRQAEPGVLSEALVRAVGVEALEDALERMGGDARPVVVDDDLDAVARSPRRAPSRAPAAARSARCRPAARTSARCR